MRKFIQKVQDLSKKAAEIQQTVQGLPGKAAELREAVVMSAGELQQIRADVQGNLNGLRANTEDRLLQAMREINDHTLVYEEAGYELTGMDLDLALAQRLSVQLRRFEEVNLSTLQRIHSQQTSETVKSVIGGLIKAEETAANVELSYLTLDAVVIHVGAIPLIRICWRSDTLLEQGPTTSSPTSGPAPAASASLSSPQFGSSFFEQRATPNVPTASATMAATTISIDPTPVAMEQKATTIAQASSNSKASALDRFKKMPDLTKRA